MPGLRSLFDASMTQKMSIINFCLICISNMCFNAQWKFMTIIASVRTVCVLWFRDELDLLAYYLDVTRCFLQLLCFRWVMECEFLYPLYTCLHQLCWLGDNLWSLCIFACRIQKITPVSSGLAQIFRKTLFTDELLCSIMYYNGLHQFCWLEDNL